MKSSKNQVLDRCFCMPRAADRDLCYLLWAAATVPRWAASPCRGVSNVGNLTGEDRGNYAGKMVMYGDFIFFLDFNQDSANSGVRKSDFTMKIQCGMG